MANLATLCSTRRDTLRAARALLVGVVLPCPAKSAAGAPLTAYLAIAPDGTITLLSPVAELGQGTWTGHLVVIADELGADPRRIAVEMPNPAPAFRRDTTGIPAMSTTGSWGIRYWYTPLRTAAARARVMLIATTAQRLRVPVSELVAEEHKVVHRATARSIGFGALAAAAAERRVPDSVQLKPQSELKLIGKGLPRPDIPAKVRGAAIYGFDLRLPEMLYACAKPSPVFGGDAESWDEAPTLALPGVHRIARIEGGVAVLAGTMWAAMRGAAALPVRWTTAGGDGLNSPTISAGLRAALGAPQAVVARSWGDAADAVRGAARVVTAEYDVPFLAHAAMEPFSATAAITGDRLDLWAPTQAPDRLVERVVRNTGFERGRIRLHGLPVGGAFGRRLHEDLVVSAVRLAQAEGRPVKLFWTRAEEIGQGWYRPAGMARLTAGLDAQGRLTVLTVRAAAAGPTLEEGEENAAARGTAQGLEDIRYRMPHYRVERVQQTVSIPTLAWRGGGVTRNAFYLECFLDEIALATERDPIDLRRELLAHDPRALRVVNLAAEKAGWGTPPPAGRARGFAFAFSFGSLCAQVAEVSLRQGRPVVHRIVCVLDCGAVVLPDAVRAQIEGGVTQGLSAALGEAVRIAGGRAANTDFDGYRILRMDQQPVVQTHVIESGDTMGGVGDSPLPPTAPAVANAVSRLTGRRVRRLPILDAAAR